MNTFIKIMTYLSLAFMMASLTACVSFGSKSDNNTQLHYYVLDVDRGSAAASFPKNRVLLLKPVRITSHYRSKNIVVKVADNQFESLANHQFFSSPQEMFTEQLMRWLQKSGQFTLVTTDKTVPADMVLEAAVTGLYGEQRQQFSPKSVLEMQFFLSKLEGGQQTELLFQTGLKIDVDIEESSPAAIVKGWKKGMFDLFATLEDDLSGYFSKRSP